MTSTPTTTLITSSPSSSTPLATATTTALAVVQTIVQRQSNINPPNPNTPVLFDNVQWITAFMVIHMLSPPSRRYMYILWFVVALVAVIAAVLHTFDLGSARLRGYWNKWAVRRRTWRGKRALELSRRKGRRQYPVSLPANGQLLALGLMCGVTAALMVAGPDYVAPNVPLFKFFRRDELSGGGGGGGGEGTLRTLFSRAQADMSQYTGFQPGYTIYRAWWTLGGRAGLIAFALIPLTVVCGLKAPPFALFALPFASQYHFDKLSWLHRWSGRLVYLVTILHVAFWSVQLLRERKTTTREIAYELAWIYTKFIYGWSAFGIFTAIILLSILPIRRHYYEAFYFLHILLVPLFLVACALHHPPVGIWCWAALGLWGAERGHRAIRWIYRNGVFSGRISTPVERSITANEKGKGRARSGTIDATSPLTMQFPISQGGSDHRYPPPNPYHPQQHHPQYDVPPYIPPYGYAQAELLSGATVRLTFTALTDLTYAPGQSFLLTIPSVSPLTSHPFTVASVCDTHTSPRVLVFLLRAKSGWTRDLWDHITALLAKGMDRDTSSALPPHLYIPDSSVLLRMWIDGPFGSAVRTRWERYESVVVVVGGTGVSYGCSILEFVVRCLGGRTMGSLGVGDGVLGFLRGKGGGGEGGMGGGGGRLRVRHVRFVWLIREFSHLQWCATVLRRCMAQVPSSTLQVDIFVTNFTPPPPNTRKQPRMPPQPLLSDLSKQQEHELRQNKDGEHTHHQHPLSPTSTTEHTLSPSNFLEPPKPQFKTRGRSPPPTGGADDEERGRGRGRGRGRSSSRAPHHHRSSSVSSDAGSEISAVDYLDLSYYTGEFGDEDPGADLGDQPLSPRPRPQYPCGRGPGGIGGGGSAFGGGGGEEGSGGGGGPRDYTLDLTNFDGDEESALPGEDEFSRRVRLAGKKRRAIARKSEMIRVKNEEIGVSSGASGVRGPVPPPLVSPSQQNPHGGVAEGEAGPSRSSSPLQSGQYMRHDAKRLSAQSTDYLLRNTDSFARSTPWGLSSQGSGSGSGSASGSFQGRHNRDSTSMDSVELDLSGVPMSVDGPGAGHGYGGYAGGGPSELPWRGASPAPSVASSSATLRIVTPATSATPTAGSGRPGSPPGRPESPLSSGARMRSPLSASSLGGESALSPRTPGSGVPFLGGAPHQHHSSQPYPPPFPPPLNPSQSHSHSHPGQYGHNPRAPSTLSHMSETSLAPSAYSMTATASDGKQARLRVSEREMHDVDAVAQFARGGKPILSKILEDELAVCKGALVVACCGPSSLNAKVRKTIAEKIRPGKNDIDFVAEDFAY